MTASEVNTPAAVMMSIAEIASRDGISKAAVSKKVKGLIADHGLAHTLDARGRVAQVNAAQYDHLREKFGNAIRSQAPRQPRETLPLDDPPPAAPPSPSASSDSLEAAQRKRAWIEAERAEMRLAEDRGDLVRVAGLIDAVRECGGKIAHLVDRLPHAADDLAAAVGRDGSHGLRVALKALAQQMREDIAAALAAIADASPETEGPQSQVAEQEPAGG
jgi:hypothetical protein